MKRIAGSALALLLALHASSGRAESADSISKITVSVRTASGTTDLSEADSTALLPRIRELFQACSLNSIDDGARTSPLPVGPDIFRRLRPFAPTWERYRAAPHVYARITPPVPIVLSERSTILLSEALIPASQDYWLTRNGTSIVIHTKCGCEADDAVRCAASVRPHLDTHSLEHCLEMDVLRRQYPSAAKPTTGEIR